VKKKIVNFIPWGPASIQVALSKQSPYANVPYRVSGCMMANHSNLGNLFSRIIRSYDTLRSRNAFLNVYKETPVFAENLDEFEDAKETITNLIEEYKAIQTSDYINWGMKQQQNQDGTGKEMDIDNAIANKKLKSAMEL